MLSGGFRCILHRVAWPSGHSPGRWVVCEKSYWRPHACEMLFPIPAWSSGQWFVAGLYQQQIIATPCQFSLHLGMGRGRGARGRGLWPLPDHLPGEALVLFSQFSAHSPVHDAGGVTATLKLHSPDCAVCQTQPHLPFSFDSCNSQPHKNFQKHNGFTETLFALEELCTAQFWALQKPVREEMLTSFYRICEASWLPNNTSLHARHSFIT